MESRPARRPLSLRTQVLLGLVAGIGAWLFQFGLAGRVIDAKGLDLLFILRGARPVPEDSVIVAIDEPSFAELRLQWPWPRSLHARLVERLRAAGARVIVFDVLFSEPSKPEEDAALVDAVKRARNVVLASDLRVVETPAAQQTLQVKRCRRSSGSPRRLGVMQPAPGPGQRYPESPQQLAQQLVAAFLKRSLQVAFRSSFEPRSGRRQVLDFLFLTPSAHR